MGGDPVSPPTVVAVLRRHAVRVAWARRAGAAACLALAVTLGLQVLHPPAPATDSVVVAARPLTAGTVLAGGDVTVAREAVQDIPAGALTTTGGAVGRQLGTDIAAHAVVTTGAVTPALNALPAGWVGVPMDLTGQAVATWLRAGERVEVFASGTATASPALLAAPLGEVLAVGPAPTGGAGAAALVAVPAAAASAVATAQRLTVALLPASARVR